MSQAMAERAVYSYRVLLFEKHADGRFKAPAEYPRRATATVTTHDLPTLNGYWSASDVALRQRLDLYPSDEMRQQVLAERVRDRHALLEALAQQGVAVPDCDGSDASYGAGLSRAIHDYLARTASALVILQAEDLLGMPDPVNVPGTSDEHANWQRKMAADLDELFADPAVTALLRQVGQARQR
jgi:4-alpha-glucanotransferase